MGVPALFRWLSKKYPKIVESVKEEEQKYAPRRERRAAAGAAAAQADEDAGKEDEEVPIPIDMSGPNPNGEEFDALYLDMNGIVHPCTHPEGKPAPETEEDMMLEVFLYTERVVNMVRPRKLLMMAIDGVAPRAKMNQQRSRRFRAAQETRQKDEEMEKALAEWKSKGVEVRGEEPGEKKKSWDRNAITPGTPFMDLLASSLRYWVAKKMNEDAGWKNLQVIISDASVPGEGEHKIMDHIRRQRAHPSHDPNTKHVIYGLDADLIMLSLATHEPYFKVLREDVFAQQPGGGGRACHKCGREGHFAANCIGEAAPKPSKVDLIDKSKKEERKPFIFLDVCVLREYLEVELAVPGLPFAFDLERAIDDWIFLIFFVGNDFLPHLPSLEIREGAIDELLKIWKRELPKMGGYVTAHGRVELQNIQNILSGIAVLEDEIFRKRREGEERQDANQKRRRIEDHARQEAEFAREKGSAGDAFRHGETEYVQVPGARAALPARPDAAAEAALADNRAKAIAALESGDTAQIIDNTRAIRMANLSAAERLKAELAGAKAQAANKAASASNKAKAKAMRNGTAAPVEEEEAAAKIVELSEDAAASSDNESFATAADAAEAAEAPVAAAADDSAVFKMDEDAPVDGGAESASARARKRTIDEVEGEVTAEGDEKIVDADEDGILKVVGDEEEVDPVVATNFERVVNADGTVTYEDTVKLWEPGYRERYYQQKFGVGLDDQEFRRSVVKSYVEGLAWVLMYYYQGCPSWTWYYPYHFSPFAADFVELESLDITFDLGKPFRPYDQLMGVLPADSRASIPPVFHSLMLDEDSEIIDFYPTDFAIDMNGKKMEWQGVALLPFIDEKRLLDAIETRYPQLSEDELRRNAFGDHALFVADTHPLYEPLCKLYAKRKDKKPLELDPSLSGGITGSVKPDPSCVPGSTYNSPLAEVGQPDIRNDQSISTLYEFPEQTTPHRSVLLKGLRPPKRVLTSEDKEWTRMGAPDRGRGRGRGRGGSSRGGALGRTEFGEVRMGAGPIGGYNGYNGVGGAGSYGGGAAASGYNSPYGGSYASSYGGSGYNTPSNGYGGNANAAWSAAPAAQQAYGAPPAGAYGGYGQQPAAQAYGGYGGTGGAYGAAYGGAGSAYGGTGAAYGAAPAYGGANSYGAAPGFGAGAYGGSGYQAPAQHGNYGGAYGAAASAYGGAPPPGAYGGYGGYGAAAPQSHGYAQQQQQQQPPRPSGPPPPLGFRGGAPSRGGFSARGRGGRGGSSGGPWGQY